MDVKWMAAFGLGIALLLAGVSLLLYEKFWRHRYRGPYLSIDIATQAIDETALQPKVSPTSPPAPVSSSWQAALGLANRLSRKAAPKPKQLKSTFSRKRLWLPVAFAVSLLVASGG